MPEIPALPAIEPSNVTDDDLLVIYDVGAATQPARKVTRGALLRGVARSEEDATFRDLDAESLSGQQGTINVLTVETGLDMGARLSRILTGVGPISMASVPANQQVTVTAALQGAIAGDVVLIQAEAQLPSGLVLQGYVLTSGVVTITAFNATGASIAAAERNLRVTALRFA